LPTAQRRVAKRVVGVDDDGPFAQVRLDASLKRVARIEQHHGTPIGSPGGAQVVEITGEDADASASAALHEIAVQVARADDRDRDRRRVRLVLNDATETRKGSWQADHGKSRNRLTNPARTRGTHDP
jgi:hypothetical protein